MTWRVTRRAGPLASGLMLFQKGAETLLLDAFGSQEDCLTTASKMLNDAGFQVVQTNPEPA